MEQTTNEEGLFFRLQLVFYIFSLVSTVFVIVFFLGSTLLENTARLNAKGIYVSVSSWDIPAFISIPTIFALVALLFLKLIGKSCEEVTTRLLKVAVVFALASIVVRIPYGFIASTFMMKQGYSRCAAYTAPAVISPSVWVRHSAYCIDNTGSVRKPLLQWLDAEQEDGKFPSPIDVEEKALMLLSEYDELQLRLYGG